MRIALTIASLDRSYGGPVTVARALSSELQALGHRVRRVGVGADPAEDVVGLPTLTDFHGTPVPASLRPVRRLIPGADVVHVLGYRDPVGTTAALTARRAGVPYVLEPKGMHRRQLRSQRLKALFDATVGRAVLAGASSIVATAQLEADELIADGIEPERIAVRPNGVELGDLEDMPERGMLRTRLGIPRDAPLVLALGRIAAKKRLDLMVEALTDLDDVWALIAGPDDSDGTADRLRRQVRDLGLSERVVIVDDGLWGDDRLAAFKDADALCLPSATENFGNAAAEAACTGLPVVVSDHCGVAEWLAPEATSVVPYEDTAALRKALSSLLTDSARVAARKAVPEIRSTLRWDRIAEEQLEIYRGVTRDPCKMLATNLTHFLLACSTDLYQLSIPALSRRRISHKWQPD